MESYVDPEEKILCPYNPAHHIMRKRMNTHLVKCKKNYPDTRLVECDFNVIHKIPEPELQYHHENCPDRRKMEISIYQEAGIEVDKYPIKNIHVPTKESWDAYNVTAYDPKKYCENNPVLRHLDVASAGSRKTFRQNERRRMDELTSSTSRPSSSDNSKCQPGTSKSAQSKDLPAVRQHDSIAEDTPDVVETLMLKIRRGASQSFMPKLK